MQLFDRNWTEIQEYKMIWADRLAICFFLLTGGMIGAIYALWGMPGFFGDFEKLAISLTLVIWFSCRVLDFCFTGKIR